MGSVSATKIFGKSKSSIKKLLGAYFECSWILGDGETEFTNVIVLYLFTFLIIHFSFQEITKLAVPFYTIKQFYKV